MLRARHIVRCCRYRCTASVQAHARAELTVRSPKSQAQLHERQIEALAGSAHHAEQCGGAAAERVAHQAQLPAGVLRQELF